MVAKKEKIKKLKTSVYFDPQIHSALKLHGFETSKPMNKLINDFCRDKLIELGLLKEDEVVEITPSVLARINNYYQDRVQDTRDILNQAPGWLNRYETEIKGVWFLLLKENDNIIIKVDEIEIQNVDLGFDKEGNVKIHRKGAFEDGVIHIMDFICLYDKLIENLRKKIKKYNEALIKIVEV